MSIVYQQILDKIDEAISAYADDPEKFMQLSFQDAQRNITVTARTFSELIGLRKFYENLLNSLQGPNGYGKVSIMRQSL
jgi:hypothetical protein